MGAGLVQYGREVLLPQPKIVFRLGDVPVPHAPGKQRQGGIQVESLAFHRLKPPDRIGVSQVVYSWRPAVVRPPYPRLLHDPVEQHVQYAVMERDAVVPVEERHVLARRHKVVAPVPSEPPSNGGRRHDNAALMVLPVKYPYSSAVRVNVTHAKLLRLAFPEAAAIVQGEHRGQGPHVPRTAGAVHYPERGGDVGFGEDVRHEPGSSEYAPRPADEYARQIHLL